MFCPFCGIKNNAEQQACFVCQKKLPALDSEPPIAKPRTNRTTSQTFDSPARLRDRLLAVDTQDRSVVVRLVTDEKIPHSFQRRQFREDRMQVILTQLARSTARGGEGRERRMALNCPLHRLILLRPAPSLARSPPR